MNKVRKIEKREDREFLAKARLEADQRFKELCDTLMYGAHSSDDEEVKALVAVQFLLDYCADWEFEVDGGIARGLSNVVFICAQHIKNKFDRLAQQGELTKAS